jgi:hypothetical protein
VIGQRQFPLDRTGATLPRQFPEVMEQIRLELGLTERPALRGVPHDGPSGPTPVGTSQVEPLVVPRPETVAVRRHERLSAQERTAEGHTPRTLLQIEFGVGEGQERIAGRRGCRVQ